MGFLETVLGFGDNHLDHPYKLFFKSITLDNDNKELSDKEVFEILDSNDKNQTIKVELQDDLYVQDDPNDTENENTENVFYVENGDEFYELLHINRYVSKKYGCVIGNSGCFIGIIIESKDESYGKDEKEEEQKETLLEKILNARMWCDELKKEGRLPENTQLVMRSNCCS